MNSKENISKEAIIEKAKQMFLNEDFELHSVLEYVYDQAVASKLKEEK
ncbi:MAG: hypothetical protein J5932_08060 [Prevotella sp.]|nr:hypothetical protein [Prevotella sp.]